MLFRDSESESLWFERDILPSLPGLGKGRVFRTDRWWSQIKTAGSAIYANRHYLAFTAKEKPQLLANNETVEPKTIGNVYIHPTANIHPTAVVSKWLNAF